MSETNKPKKDFVPDNKDIIRLEAIPTADYAFEEITGDPTKKIIYYQNGVLLTTKDGLGNITRYKDDKLYFEMENLKEVLRNVFNENVESLELRQRLIDGMNKIIDEYVAELETKNGV